MQHNNEIWKVIVTVTELTKECSHHLLDQFNVPSCILDKVNWGNTDTVALQSLLILQHEGKINKLGLQYKYVALLFHNILDEYKHKYHTYIYKNF